MRNIEHVRIALGGVSTEPLLLDGADILLRGQAAHAIDITAVARRLAVFSRGVTAATQARVTLAQRAVERVLARALAVAARR